MEQDQQKRVEEAAEYLRSCKDSPTFDIRKIFGLSEEEARIIEAKVLHAKEANESFSESCLSLGLQEVAVNPEFNYTLWFTAFVRATDSAMMKISGKMGEALLGRMFGKE